MGYINLLCLLTLLLDRFSSLSDYLLKVHLHSHISDSLLTRSIPTISSYLSAIYLTIYCLAYFLSFRRAIDSHLLEVPGVSTCFGSEARMNPKQHLSIPIFVPVAPLRLELGTAVICKLWARPSLQGVLATLPFLFYSL